MDPTAIDEAYVIAAARAVGLELPSGHLGAVTGILRQIAAVAAPVCEVPLAVEDESAPVWRP